MTTLDDLVRETFAREGTVYAEPPLIDQPTAPGGIIIGTYRDYIAATDGGDRVPTVADLKRLTVATATPVVRWVFERLAHRSGLDAIPDDALRVQMLDFAYNSGPALALRWLQRVLRVPRTGQMDAATRDAIKAADPWLTHHALIAARLLMIDLSTDSGTIAKAYEEGLENRALTFSRLAIP